MHNGAEQVGIVTDKGITSLALNRLEDCMGLTAAGVRSKSSKEIIPLKRVRLLAPVQPSKIICLGWNYLEHIEELKHNIPEQPMVFLKPPSGIIGPEDDVILPNPRISSQVNNEVELAVVVGKRSKNVRTEDAYSHVLGYTVAQDITARDIQWRLRQKNEQWDIAKAFDTFTPIGPYVVTPAGIKNPHNLAITLRVNGKIRQDSNTKYMIFKIPEVISYLSSVMTLLPGDVISTGTPKGVDLIKDGDVLEAEIEGVGVLRNRVSK